jgi:hypothetical protein
MYLFGSILGTTRKLLQSNENISVKSYESIVTKTIVRIGLKKLMNSTINNTFSI